MGQRGWEQLVAPIELPSTKFATLFFAKDGDECSIVILSQPSGIGATVLVTRTVAVGRSDP